MKRLREVDADRALAELVESIQGELTAPALSSIKAGTERAMALKNTHPDHWFACFIVINKAWRDFYQRRYLVFNEETSPLETLWKAYLHHRTVSTFALPRIEVVASSVLASIVKFIKTIGGFQIGFDVPHGPTQQVVGSAGMTVTQAMKDLEPTFPPFFFEPIQFSEVVPLWSDVPELLTGLHLFQPQWIMDQNHLNLRLLLGGEVVKDDLNHGLSFSRYSDIEDSLPRVTLRFLSVEDGVELKRAYITKDPTTPNVATANDTDWEYIIPDLEPKGQEDEEKWNLEVIALNRSWPIYLEGKKAMVLEIKRTVLIEELPHQQGYRISTHISIHVLWFDPFVFVSRWLATQRPPLPQITPISAPADRELVSAVLDYFTAEPGDAEKKRFKLGHEVQRVVKESVF